METLLINVYKRARVGSHLRGTTVLSREDGRSRKSDSLFSFFWMCAATGRVYNTPSALSKGTEVSQRREKN